MDYPTGGDLASTQPPVAEKMADCNPPLPGDSGGYDATVWRQELSARLERYRLRRKPRAPKYPSLRLPFEAADNWAFSTSQSISSAPPPVLESVAIRVEESAMRDSESLLNPAVELEPEATAKIIEFPRSAAIPALFGSELAEPVLERPRIIEAPEVVPPPPALGGILIEPPADRNKDKRHEPDFLLPQASIARRLAASLVDGVVAMSALAIFGAIFLRLNPERAALPLLLGGGAFAAALLWACYQYLLLVYTGTTLGLLAARLRLARFDGGPVARRGRRWRVLGSYLSALALGLGYVWCLLDEDALCWHDRITRTHVTPR
jgi:uncharacterized RDD family membrane protein YckC